MEPTITTQLWIYSLEDQDGAINQTSMSGIRGPERLATHTGAVGAVEVLGKTF